MTSSRSARSLASPRPTPGNPSSRAALVSAVASQSHRASTRRRAELAYRTLLELREPQRSHFLNTVERIRDNLSVPRDERDAEICAKVAEIKKIADDQTRVYDESTRSPL